jgi:prophage DNA circulation protein
VIQLERLPRRLRRPAAGAAWVVVAGLIAFGGSGLVAAATPPPGTPARAELTWAGDAAIRPGLASATAALADVGTSIDRLGTLARATLAAMVANDARTLDEALTEGTALATQVETGGASITAEIAALPGTGPYETLQIGSQLLRTRDAILAAAGATAGLPAAWNQLSSAARTASRLMALLIEHDTVTGEAAQLGRGTRYDEALARLQDSARLLAQAQVIRDDLAHTTDVSTLDQWMARDRRYDAALVALYTALRGSGDRVTDAVRAAAAEEEAARATLPPDSRGLTVILADIGRGRASGSVIAIEQARGSVLAAIGTLAPPGG